jgi:hypothetical protein
MLKETRVTVKTVTREGEDETIDPLLVLIEILIFIKATGYVIYLA